MTPLELIELSIRLEYSLDQGGLLVPFTGSTEQARFIIYRHAGGYVTYFRHDLPEFIQEQILALPRGQAFDDHETIKRLLAIHAPCRDIWIGGSCWFASIPAQGDFPDAALDENRWVIKINGEAVAWAWMVRGNDLAVEVAVETKPEFQRWGFGRQVTAAWARDVMSREQVAFYSYHHDNAASQALAKSLGLVKYADGVAYD
ncbi:MAG: GNAT family N-acetyltransferase [Chloroflexota bacterium]